LAVRSRSPLSVTALSVPPDDVPTRVAPLVNEIGPPASVPPLSVTESLNVDAAATDRLPPESVIGSLLVMLLTKSDAEKLCVMGFETAMLIMTSSLTVGIAPLDQLAGVSQSPPLGLIQETDMSLRVSSISRQEYIDAGFQTFRDDRRRLPTPRIFMPISELLGQPC
jgi:hypothetical protein